MKHETPIMPPHIEETIQAIAKFHSEHYDQIPPLQGMIERTTAIIGHRWFVVILSVLLLLWLLVHGVTAYFGIAEFDTHLLGLQVVLGIGSLYTAILILTTQRREDQLAVYRDQLTLELAILGEQKSAKIIELMEKLREDHPEIQSHSDPQAAAMAAPTDPKALLKAIKNARVTPPSHTPQPTERK